MMRDALRVVSSRCNQHLPQNRELLAAIEAELSTR